MKYEVSYSDNLPEWVGGNCSYPWYPMFGTCKITIRPKYKDDLGILNHEICHAKQYGRKFFHGLMTKFSGKYRYECELEAYTEQIKAYNYTSIDQAMWIVDALCNKYNLKISRDDALKRVAALI